MNQLWLFPHLDLHVSVVVLKLFVKLIVLQLKDLVEDSIKSYKSVEDEIMKWDVDKIYFFLGWGKLLQSVFY